jgi:hypothetical protein
MLLFQFELGTWQEIKTSKTFAILVTGLRAKENKKGFIGQTSIQPKKQGEALF